MTQNLDKMVAELSLSLNALQKKADAQAALSKKIEIDSLVAEASRDGKILPFDNDDLYAEKDGVLTIKMEPALLAKAIEKTPRAIGLHRKPLAAPKTLDGQAIPDRLKDRAAWREATREFAQKAKQEGAIQLGRFIKETAAAAQFGN